ncbi:hypothetical protein SDC9_129842 [bioreactor metagenome]|uniref:Uncharacterized protein n=1 Tax=bioreactor metagenome TaxID=1076179 RepID=A0A645CZX6_9ZZZZ
MGDHTRHRRLSVGSRHTDSIAADCDLTKQLRPFHHHKAVLPEIEQFAMGCRYGWRIDDQCLFVIEKRCRNSVDIILIMDKCPFIL